MVGKMGPKEDDKRTRGEKIQDITRDIFVFLVILLVLVIPTTYIVIRGSQPMTIPGYEDVTFFQYLKDQFVNHVDDDMQTRAFFEVMVSPYAAVIEVATKLNPEIDTRTKGQVSSITLRDVPDSWWASIQNHCIFWLKRAAAIN